MDRITLEIQGAEREDGDLFMKNITVKRDHDARPLVLIVEDEAPIRLLMWHILSRAGYRLCLAIDGIDGLQKLNELERVDLLLTDLAMPGLNGVQLAERAQIIHPQIKIVYATGSQDCFPEFREDIRCVLKPFTVEELLKSVREALVTVERAVFDKREAAKDASASDAGSCAFSNIKLASVRL